MRNFEFIHIINYIIEKEIHILMDYRYLSTEVIGGFTGVMLGLFAQGDDGYADFDWFEYTTE